MKARKMVFVSVVFRLGILLLCFTLFYMHSILGQRYFNRALSGNAQRRAVQEASNLDVRNRFGLTGLMFAAIYGQLDLARALVQQGASLNLQGTKERNTALHLAMNNMRSQISMDVGTYLIDVYANTRIKNKYGQTPLHLTISTDVDSNWIAMVDRLIKNGSDINAQTNQGDTILHLAVNMKKTVWAQTLLSRYGALLNLNIKNKHGWTPYEYALELGFSDFAKVFQQNPVRRINKAGQRDGMGMTGLMLAIMRHDQQAVETMVKDQAVLNERSDDQYQNSALHLALLFEDVSSIATLLKVGASRTTKNAQGEIPLHYLVRMGRPKFRMRAATLLLDQKPETLSVKTDRGDTLLHYIVRFNDIRLLSFLIKRYRQYLDVSIKNKALQTPIALASQMRRARIGKMLLGLK